MRRRVSISFSPASYTLLSTFSSSLPLFRSASLSPLFRAGFTSDELDRREPRDLSTGSQDSLLFHIVSPSSPSSDDLASTRVECRFEIEPTPRRYTNLRSNPVSTTRSADRNRRRSTTPWNRLSPGMSTSRTFARRAEKTARTKSISRGRTVRTEPGRLVGSNGIN